jgi:HAMP domain-containing protein
VSTERHEWRVVYSTSPEPCKAWGCGEPVQYFAVYTFQHAGDPHPTKRISPYCARHASSWAEQYHTVMPSGTPPMPIQPSEPVPQPTEPVIRQSLMEPEPPTRLGRFLKAFTDFRDEWRRARGRPTPLPVRVHRPGLGVHAPQGDWDLEAQLRPPSLDDVPEQRWRGVRSALPADEMARHSWRTVNDE